MQSDRARKAIEIGGFARFLLPAVLAAWLAPFPAHSDVTIHRAPSLVDASRVTAAALQKELGTDPRSLFLYVRDRVRNDSYAGALRGADGTLLAQSGNSIDKAILLSDLLRRAGHRTRFVRGELGTQKAEALLRSFLRPKESAAATTAASPDAQALGFLDAVKKQAPEAYRTVATVLRRGGVKPTAPPGAAREAMLADARQHYWVQFLRGKDWIDADASFANRDLGSRNAPVIETFKAIPERLFHQIVVRVILESASGERRRKTTLLERRARAADWGGKTLVLTHQPGSWTKPQPAAALAGAMTVITNTLGGLFGGRKPPAAPTEARAKPVLLVGNAPIQGTAFDIPHPKTESAARWAALQDQPTGEWIELEFRSPDGRVAIAQRAIFDRIGFAARQRGETKINQGLLGARHPLGSLYCISFYSGPLTNPEAVAPAGAAAKPTRVAAKGRASVVEIAGALESINHAVSSLADRFAASLFVGKEAVSFTLAAPRAIITSVRSSAEGAFLTTDITHAEYRPLAPTPLLEKSFDLQVARGILDGIVEATVIETLFRDAGLTGERIRPGAYSASRVFRQAAEERVAASLLRDAGNPMPKADDEALARIAADLKAGNLVIVPERPVALDGRKRSGWWRIDPRSGATTAVTEDGLHAAQTEYGVMVYEMGGRSTMSVYTIEGGVWNPTVFMNVPSRLFQVLLRTNPGSQWQIFLFWMS